MNEPKTPNLGLNKIDRSSPSTTYFDLDKYLDQNWEKIDGFAEQVEEKVGETAAQVSSIQERLDTEQRRSVTLEPGLQIINAERASAFKLEGLKGRTLVNLLGRDGGFEGYSNWDIGAASATLDTTVSAQGSMSSLKVTLASTNSNISKEVSTSVGKTYVLIADVKNVSTSSTFVSISTVVNGNIVTGSTFGTSFARFTATASTHLIAVVGGGASGQVFNADNVRLYEVSSAEYVALNSMTPEQVATKYPYVDSVQPVRNPYAIRYGENLLPPLYEANRVTAASKVVADGRYGVKFGVGGDMDFIAFHIQVIPNSDYTFSYEHEGYSSVTFEGAGWAAVDTSYSSGITGYSYEKVKTFNVGNRSTIAIVIRSFDSSKTVSCKNWMLTLGKTVEPFKSREDAMLVLQTELHANPDTGANPDTVFEQGGQYFKAKKWRRLVLDGALAWGFGDAVSTGLKQVKVVGLVTGGVAGSGVATKYEGKIVPQGSTGSVADTNAVSGSGDFYISIPNTDSGWGDSYTPTTDEIKAYFMGWKMYDVNTNPDGSGVFNRTDGVGKWFVPVDQSSSGVNVLPTTKVSTVASYQLLYQLATPVVEPITSEGQLTLFKGDNQVEVGTGIVLREGLKPALYPPDNNYYINSQAAATKLVNKVGKFIHVYANSRQVYDWSTSTNADSWGAQRLYKDSKYFNPTPSYTVTYLMLDKYPVVSLDGTYADNEKSLLLDAVKSLQENTTRISVLESKKAEKDAPVWITPTLVNGWTNYSDLYQPIGYYKDSHGLTHLRGLIRGGANTNGASIFRLPVGYRPKKAILFNTLTSNSTALVAATVEISPDGVVYLGFAGGNTWLNLENISFIAEQ
ncbi:hypothetical protein [Paenibacillus sp. QZ-Y1]|uniref:hypothetical protein n=1 Tax=Paenibacillus sp. QZ-Y1 TaxID=3414511 RepID=UPI003F7AE6CD